jgi:hypothetical protein
VNFNFFEHFAPTEIKSTFVVHIRGFTHNNEQRQLVRMDKQMQLLEYSVKTDCREDMK